MGPATFKGNQRKLKRGIHSSCHFDVTHRGELLCLYMDEQTMSLMCVLPFPHELNHTGIYVSVR